MNTLENIYTAISYSSINAEPFFIIARSEQEAYCLAQNEGYSSFVLEGDRLPLFDFLPVSCHSIAPIDPR